MRFGSFFTVLSREGSLHPGLSEHPLCTLGTYFLSCSAVSVIVGKGEIWGSSNHCPFSSSNCGKEKAIEKRWWVGMEIWQSLWLSKVNTDLEKKPKNDAILVLAHLDTNRNQPTKCNEAWYRTVTKLWKEEKSQILWKMHMTQAFLSKIPPTAPGYFWKWRDFTSCYTSK